MTYFYLLISLCAVDLLAAMSPGPNFLLVVQTSIQRTRPHAVAVVAGLTSANLIWCAAVVFGLATLFKVAPWLYLILKLSGGAYLIYLGIRLWLTKSNIVEVNGLSESTLVAAYIRGLLTNLSNPKSVVYFGSIFALFMRPGVPLWAQFVAVSIVLFDTLLWYGTVAMMFSNHVVRQFYTRIQPPIDRITSCVMIGFGVKLILTPKSAS